jgi:hypothetical protein
MIEKNNPILYILFALIGAILLTSSYHFSLQNKYKICALIPALPIIGLTGLFFITLNKGNTSEYILNHIRFLLITTSLYFFILIFLYFKYDLLLSLIFSFVLWFIFVYMNFFNN